MKHKRAMITATALAVLAGGVGAAMAVSAYADGTPTPARATPHPASAPILPAGSGPVPATVTTQAAATNAHCGQAVTASLTLNGDLSCATAPALRVTGSSVVVNLNGHAVNGPGAGSGLGSGIVVAGTSDTVENGYVQNWPYGLEVIGVKDAITKITAERNENGIYDHGSLTKVTANTVLQNLYDGIIGEANGGSYTGNRVAGNDWGIATAGASAQTVSGNTVDGNYYYGIYIEPSASGTYTGNSADYNGSDGIYNAGQGLVADGGGNTAHGNDYNGGAAEQCWAITCS